MKVTMTTKKCKSWMLVRVVRLPLRTMEVEIVVPRRLLNLSTGVKNRKKKRQVEKKTKRLHPCSEQ
jgi:hypothetical protein